jgi:cytoskeletal protein RodZ
MSLTLGEKLRQAREERGMTISEVAEQTRISALYLESIENNDFRPLPGGIFNKGFVKSYARHLGLNEQEALQDYADILTQQGGDVNEDPKTFTPEVLTDERSRSGLLPTLIFSFIIVGLIVWGVLAFLRNYTGIQDQYAANTNTNTAVNTNTDPTPTPTPVISTNEIKVELKTLTGPVWIASISDERKANGLVSPEKTAVYQPKEKLRISYAREQAQNVQITVNGKQIQMPDPPAKGTVTFEINKNNIAQILQSGTISSEMQTAPSANTAAPRR